ncbi:uncharacterized protein BDR25DRAFT_352470 [Lindgomyces ingoldianus]|uniref:Uncharacterized protein n=1 Tax=Lindgomyces ingoldianus TaxID=673940 RepID=A0ACB6R6B9_9PLEO|nr:uncharacterized protein BDR25DRAFT_352470 [Lindgomyces ingoldianus]KAF2474006.1 hypothetical protein BDR25DRAFT_352470 [Lindgomyces ingoldianus]
MNRSISSRPEPPEGPRIGPDLDLAPTPALARSLSPHALPYASEWIHTAFGPIVLPAPLHCHWYSQWIHTAFGPIVFLPVQLIRI